MSHLPRLLILEAALLLLLPFAALAAPPGSASAPISERYFPAKDFSGLRPSKTLALLPIRGFQQTTDYTCGPAAILTLLEFYGIPADEQALAQEMRTRPGSGTHPLSMVSCLRKHGLEVEWGEETLGDGSGMKMIRKNLESGIPTIVEWIDWGGHYALVIGHDNRGTETVDDDVIILADPYDRHDDVEDGVTVFNAERFYYMWFDRNCFDRPYNRLWIKAVPKKGRSGRPSR